MTAAVTSIELPGVQVFKRGKVRDIFSVGEYLLIVATDRISAFDVVLPTAIPEKGKLLTAMTLFWLERIKHIVPTHLVTADVGRYPEPLPKFRQLLEGRSMLVHRCRVLPVECIVRGYLAGSAWEEYQRTGAAFGQKLPEGLLKGAQLPEPLFTPTTKATTGHDQPLSEDELRQLLGRETAGRLKELSLRIYRLAADYARQRGIIIADTKFEFGIKAGELMLVDEVLTPDSSRFWPADEYQLGKSLPSWDKQYVRDYLEGLCWDKTPPAPELPVEVVEKTRSKYQQAYKALVA
jgi:phosphoribosylaminoimidazole-succinocarboxamide synthase